MLGIPAGSSSAKTLRLTGKGFHDRMGARDDQLVTLMLDVPADDARLKSFLQDWRDGSAVRAHLGVRWNTALSRVFQQCAVPRQAAELHDKPGRGKRREKVRKD